MLPGFKVAVQDAATVGEVDRPAHLHKHRHN